MDRIEVFLIHKKILSQYEIEKRETQIDGSEILTLINPNHQEAPLKLVVSGYKKPQSNGKIVFYSKKSKLSKDDEDIILDELNLDVELQHIPED